MGSGSDAQEGWRLVAVAPQATLMSILCCAEPEPPSASGSSGRTLTPAAATAASERSAPQSGVPIHEELHPDAAAYWAERGERDISVHTPF